METPKLNNLKSLLQTLLVGETGAGWRTGLVDFFDLSEYYWTHRTVAPSTDQRYDYAQLLKIWLRKIVTQTSYPGVLLFMTSE